MRISWSLRALRLTAACRSAESVMIMASRPRCMSSSRPESPGRSFAIRNGMPMPSPSESATEVDRATLSRQ
ncbi:hypothetical protein [Nonomuraea dietziae]|uniref:hypothetical protein n=1 Tax=Nonomuraea dietziae TaxID=65515 RepID=UPI0031E1A85C